MPYNSLFIKREQGQSLPRNLMSIKSIGYHKTNYCKTWMKLICSKLNSTITVDRTVSVYDPPIAKYILDRRILDGDVHVERNGSHFQELANVYAYRLRDVSN